LSVEPTRIRSILWRLFAAAWLAYAFFHQGGGWSQNARFAMVRAIVEESRFSIDSYLFYSGVESTVKGRVLARARVVEGRFQLLGQEWALAWPGENPVPVGEVAEGAALVGFDRLAVTDRLAFARGRFYAKQAPGAALLGVPAYFALYHVERWFGVDPDNLWALTLNAWLTTALSLGLVSALACVVFLRVALVLWDGRLYAAVWSTVAFAFGTLFFPYATMLYEHNVAATGLLVAFWLLLPAGNGAASRSRAASVLAGVAAGWAAISTYAAVIPVLMLLIYAVARGRRGSWLGLGVGLAAPFAVAGFYHWVCFGSPFLTSFHFADPYAQQMHSFLDVLGRPRLGRLVGVLVSPFRGLLFSSPVLLAGVVGLVAMLRDRARRAEATLFAAVFAFFLLLNISDDGWHGGWSVGPRYLIAGLPFLALPVTYGFLRYFRTTTVLALLSIVTMITFTAVDPQPSVGLSSIARHPGRAGLLREPLTEYALPIFLTGRPGPILRAQLEDLMRKAEEDLVADEIPEDEWEHRLAEYRERLEGLVEEGHREFLLASFVGPVSANPIGMYEGLLGHLIKPPAEELRWNSFNAGELLLPWRRSSLLFLLLLAGPLVVSSLAVARDGVPPGPS